MKNMDNSNEAQKGDGTLPASEDIGKIVGILLNENLVVNDQIQYARRVQTKLPTPLPIIEILKALNYITDQQIQETIRSHRLSMRIGDLLVELGHLREADLQSAFQIQTESKIKKKLGEILVEHNFIDEKKFIEVLSIQMGFPYVDPQFSNIDLNLFSKAPSKWYEDHLQIPIRQSEEGVVVAFVDPLDKHELDAAKQVFGENVLPAISVKRSIFEAVKKTRRSASGKRRSQIDQDTVVGVVETIIMDAVKDDASDIHIEPLSDRLRIRFRQDGVLNHYKDYSKDIIAGLTSRIKIMCEADIAEKRRHQDGRILFELADVQIDLRVSIYVTIHGEKIVLRLLKQEASLLKVEKIGFGSRLYQRFKEQVLDRPSGIVIVTGPTGSGKTTTIYSFINYLNNPMTSIVTAEDPVEYVIDGIAQCSINPKLNLTFEETLRHIVRQDPDVVVIGEIRDRFSANVAVEAALTGHKVLSTFHTEDSVGGIIRLLNMDIEPFLVSSTVASVISQRLLRRPCPTCAVPDKPSVAILRRLGYSPSDVAGTEFKIGRGCPQCRYTGYKGRVAVFEILFLEEELRNAILTREASHKIREISIESSGLVSLLEDGILKAAKGATTLEEVLRCLPYLYQPRPVAELRRIAGD
jgi:type IV pilus assembly protein PilB